MDMEDSVEKWRIIRMNNVDSIYKMFGVDIDKLLNQIKNECTRKDKEIDSLREENKKLKASTYKDSELKNIKAELDKARNDLRRGFSISEEDKRKIDEWKIKHEEEVHRLKTMEDRQKAQGCVGGVYEFRFIPTTIGIIGQVICSRCGEEFTFQELN